MNIALHSLQARTEAQRINDPIPHRNTRTAATRKDASSRRARFAALAVVVSFAPLTYAQSDQGKLEEVIVTAQRRSESLQDVPASVQAISRQQIENARIETAADLEVVVPGLVYSEVGYSSPYLRGVGNNLLGFSADPGVATYVDGVYQAGVSMNNVSEFELARVEVLRGPQTTLYGRNAIGGVISFVTNDPVPDFDARLTVGTGNLSRQEVSGSLSGGATQDLAVGLYGSWSERDAYSQNINAAASGDEKAKTWQGRLKAIWTPTEQLKLTVNARYAEIDDPQRTLWRDTTENSLAHAVFGTEFLQPNKVDLNSPVLSESRQNSQSVRMDYTFANDITLSSITARDDNVTSIQNDVDGSPINLLFSGVFNPPGQTNKNFSQEVQLISPSDGRLTWIVGALYFDEERKQRVYIDIPVIGRRTDNRSAWFGRSREPYAELTYKLTDRFSVTAGARYVTEDRSQNGQVTVTQPPVGVQPRTYSSSKYDRTNPRVTFTFKQPGTLLYATYAEGFKSGGASDPDGPDPVKPEIVKNYEVGTKLELLDQRLRLNLSAFKMDYEDKVVSTLTFPAGIALTQNAASATIKGAEMEVAMQLAPSVQVGANASYLDAEYDSFEGASAYESAAPAPGLRNIRVDLSGQRMENAPEFSGAVFVSYEVPLGTAGSLSGSTNYRHSSSYNLDSYGGTTQSSYGQLGSSLSYTSPNGQWVVTAWGKNLTDKHYITGSTTTSFARIVIDGPPRSYGLNLTWFPARR